MSMLAEPRRKANWVLNPKNTHWTADTTKFGLRIMENMGWTQGSGLGANEQGSTEHIKVAVRSDNRGVGFKDRPEDVLVHQTEFSELLQQLATNTPPGEESGDEKKPAEITSLEERSQNSRSRVHYRKFTRGKDLSQYSEKDLASILGKPAPVNLAKNNTTDDGKETQFQSDVVTVGGGNMLDYFRKKMTSFHSRDKAGDVITSEETCTDYGRSDMHGTGDDIAETNVGKKKKKSTRVSTDIDQGIFEAELKGVENSEGDVETKKERKRKAQDAVENTNINLSLSSEDCGIVVNDAALGLETKKDRKRRRKAEKALKSSVLETHVEDATNEEIHIKRDTKSKRKSKSACENTDHNGENDKDVLDAEAFTENKEAKRNRKATQSKLENSQCEKHLEIATESTGCSNDKKLTITANKEERKKERKQKKIMSEEDKSVTNEVEVNEIIESDTADQQTKKKKSKKSKKSRKVSDQGTDSSEAQFDAIDLAEAKSKKAKSKSDNDITKEFVSFGQANEGRNKKRKRDQECNIEKGIEDADEALKKESKHKKRKKNHAGAIDVKEEVLLNEKPKFGVAMDINEPQVFCDVRTKNSKMKGKLHKLAESSEHSGSASYDKLVDISINEVECSVEKESKKKLKQDKQNSQTATSEAIKEKKSKRENRETIKSETLEKLNYVSNDNAECVVEKKKNRKRKKKSKIPPASDTCEPEDVLAREIECTAEREKEKKCEMSDCKIVKSAEQIHILSNENTIPAEEICLEDQNIIGVGDNVADDSNLRALKNLENDIDGVENDDFDVAVSTKLNIQGIDNIETEIQVTSEREATVVSAELNIGENGIDTDIHVTNAIKSGVDEKAQVGASNIKEIHKVTSSPAGEVESKGSAWMENENALKKPVSILKLGGKVYINGICNYDLPQPEIKNVELQKIPVQMRDNVMFLPFPGANVDDFGYIGLNFNKK